MVTNFRSSGYSDVYRSLVFAKEAHYYDDDHSHFGGLVKGLGTGALIGGAIGAGPELYDIDIQRRELLKELESAAKTPKGSRVFPNFVTLRNQKAKGGRAGRMYQKGVLDPQAQFLYDLTEKEMQGLRSTRAPRLMRDIMTPKRLKGAISKIEGIPGALRYMGSRNLSGALTKGLHYGIPGALIGGGLLALTGD